MSISMGEKIKIVLKRRNMTLGELAEITSQSRQNLSNKFGILPGGNVGIFWYNSLAFTRQCSSALRKKCDETAGRGTGGHQMGGKHA